MAGVLKVYNASTSTWENVVNVATSQFTLVENQVPTGTINGTNKDFSVATGFVGSTLKVYKNGQRLKPGGADYTATSTGFTMVTAPATGTVLLCDYALGDGTNIVGGNSLISDEIPTGTINGTNKTFTTARGYVGATLEVFINGLKQRRGADFTETTPSSGTFTMDEAPLTGDSIFVNYSYNLNPSSNADTVDGINASTTPTANTLYPLDANAKLAESIFPTSTGWTAPTLSNNWVNYGAGYADAGYRKDALNRVQFRGLLKNGTTTSGTLIFTLPTGFRPSQNLIFITKTAGTSYGETRVNSNGQVTIGDAVWNTGWSSIDNVAFHAEQ